jgi:glycosyltransferase involved in cell wall biosynthesis
LKVGCIIPVYNIGKLLDGVLEKIGHYIPVKNIVIVDDGSEDDTADYAEKHHAVLIRHCKNLGKGAALRTGFHWSESNGYDAVFTIDGDGQHDPARIPDFIRKMNEGADIILGSRQFSPGTMPIDRIFSNYASTLMVSLLAGRRLQDSQCGYRLIRTRVLQSLNLFTNRYELETELLVKAIRKGWQVSFCPVPAIYNEGISHIQRFPDTVRFCRLFIKLMYFWGE